MTCEWNTSGADGADRRRDRCKPSPHSHSRYTLSHFCNDSDRAEPKPSLYIYGRGGGVGVGEMEQFDLMVNRIIWSSTVHLIYHILYHHITHHNTSYSISYHIISKTKKSWIISAFPNFRAYIYEIRRSETGTGSRARENKKRHTKRISTYYIREKHFFCVVVVLICVNVGKY